MHATEPSRRTEAFAALDWVLLTAVAVVWGSTFLFIDIAVNNLAPGLVSFGRIAVGAATLAAFPAARATVARAAWPGIALLGVLWMAIPWTLLPVAQQWIDSSLAGMLNGAAPLITAVVATILARLLPGRRQVIGLVIGFVGVAVITVPAMDVSDSASVGIALVLLATLLYGVAFNLTGSLQRRSGILPVIWRAQIAAALVTAPYAVLGLPDSSFDVASLTAVAVLGVLGTALAPVSFTLLVGRVGSTRASVAVYFLPAVAIVLGALFLGESIAVTAVVGTALVTIGAYLTSRKERAASPSSLPTSAA